MQVEPVRPKALVSATRFSRLLSSRQDSNNKLIKFPQIKKIATKIYYTREEELESWSQKTEQAEATLDRFPLNCCSLQLPAHPARQEFIWRKIWHDYCFYGGGSSRG